MPSIRKITRDGRNCFEIRFSIDKQRKSITLAGIDDAQAETWLKNVTHLLDCRRRQLARDRTVSHWLGLLTGPQHAKLSDVGLIEPMQQVVRRKITLGEYLDSFFSDQSTLKQSSRVSYSQTRSRLVEFFGRDRELESISAIDARAFRKWLHEESNKRDKAKNEKGERVKPGLAINTVRRRCGVCRQIFNQALTDGEITRNPFAGMSVTVRSNKERQFYVDLETFAKVLHAAPNSRWRALLVLARIGALRVPSEITTLKWSDVAWDAKRITVRSPKTEHHAGKESRIVPLFQAIETELLKLHLESPEGDEVFGLRADSNLRTQLQKIIRRAGVKQWPKLWQNLRASGATDLAKSLPVHVATAICGHSIQIAQEHYWQVTDTDLDKAIRDIPPVPTVVPTNDVDRCQSESVDDQDRKGSLPRKSQ